jgi:hypothetical protein
MRGVVRGVPLQQQIVHSKEEGTAAARKWQCENGNVAMGSVLTFDTRQGFIGKEGWRRASMIPFLGAELSISSSS